MIPWVHHGSAEVPGGGTLRLKQRGAEFSIMLGTSELMNSRLSGSEEALARLTIAKLTAADPNVLIGGLGMGFTLRAALSVLPETASVTVAELVPEVVAWARGPMADLFAGCLDDLRVRVEVTDVGRSIRSSKTAYDAIMLDVDNGPEGMSRAGNDALYSVAGLHAAGRALKPGGVLAIWSAVPDEGFTRRLKSSGFSIEEHKVRAHRGKSGTRHIIWLATRTA